MIYSRWFNYAWSLVHVDSSLVQRSKHCVERFPLSKLFPFYDFVWVKPCRSWCFFLAYEMSVENFCEALIRADHIRVKYSLFSCHFDLAWMWSIYMICLNCVLVFPLGCNKTCHFLMISYCELECNSYVRHFVRAPNLCRFGKFREVVMAWGM